MFDYNLHQSDKHARKASERKPCCQLAFETNQPHNLINILEALLLPRWQEAERVLVALYLPSHLAANLEECTYLPLSEIQYSSSSCFR